MSETVTHIGRMREVETNLSPDEFFEILCRDRGYERGAFHTSWEQVYLDNTPKHDYILSKGKLWTVVENNRAQYEDICEVYKSDNGDIHFVLQFYNGGTCFVEMIDEALSKLK